MPKYPIGGHFAICFNGSLLVAPRHDRIETQTEPEGVSGQDDETEGVRNRVNEPQWGAIG